MREHCLQHQVPTCKERLVQERDGTADCIRTMAAQTPSCPVVAPLYTRASQDLMSNPKSSHLQAPLPICMVGRDPLFPSKRALTVLTWQHRVADCQQSHHSSFCSPGTQHYSHLHPWPASFGVVWQKRHTRLHLFGFCYKRKAKPLNQKALILLQLSTRSHSIGR